MLPNLKALERQYIEQGLNEYGKTLPAKRKIAHELGISLKGLYLKIKSHGLDGKAGPRTPRRPVSGLDNGSPDVEMGESSADRAVNTGA